MHKYHDSPPPLCGPPSLLPTQSLKFYDVANFDMTLMVELTQEPGCCVWTYRSGSSKTLVRRGLTSSSLRAAASSHLHTMACVCCL